MPPSTDSDSPRPHFFNGWRVAGWGAALALLLLPAIAMRFGEEVNWTPGDFLAAAMMLVGLGAGIELAVRVAQGAVQRCAIIAASIAGFLTFWLNGAVGIVGDEGRPINLAFYALVLLAVVASFVVKFRAKPMLAITAAMVAGQIAIGFVAEFTFQPEWGPVLFMAFLWLIPALLFWKAAAD